MTFDTILIADWSGRARTGFRPGPDAIWTCVARGGVTDPPVYHANRAAAEDALAALFREEIAAGRRVFAGFDFPFGYPAGFAARLTGAPDPLGLWDWYADRLEEADGTNNRFDLAAEINARFPGQGPFWFNALKRDIPGLPRTKPGRDHGLADRRAAEDRAKGAFTCWQMGGTGAVGSQVMTGMATLARLRRRLPGQLAAWPFEPLDTPVALIEVWPSLIAPAIRPAPGEVKDAAQVRTLATAIARLDREALADMLDVQAPEEGWIFGLGHEDTLARAADAPLAPPPLRDNCFSLPPGVEWMAEAEALDRLRASMSTVVGRERVGLSDALGRILAEPVAAVRANPPGANAAVDGYGFAHAATGEGPQEMPLVAGRAAAGGPFRGIVPAGSALRILTGALLPQGVDTVVLEEDTTTDGTRVAFRGPVKKGANTRRAGEDVEAGAPILPAGRRLTPADLALIAATGGAEVPVYRPLRVGVLSTGDEIAAPGTPAPPERTYDANRPMLLAMLAAMGVRPVDLGHVADDRDLLRARLDEAARQTDAILTSGGASAGDEDHVSAILRAEARLTAWRIAVKPGRPLALAQWKGVPVFGLPGNPVAAFVCACVFARPALGLMAGADWVIPQPVTVPAAFSKTKKPGRSEYLRARLDANGHAEVFKSEGSGRISGLSWAEGLVHLPPGAAEIVPGTPVAYLPYSAFGL